MNADAVQATTYALLASWVVGPDVVSQRVALGTAERDARTAVAAAEPIIRAQIAAEIEAECERESHGGVDDDGFHRIICPRCHKAAHIARGGAS